MNTLTVRIDVDVEAALDQLTTDGRSRSEVVREAVLAAARARRREQLRDESRRLAEDPQDLAEARAIQVGMEPFRAW